MNEQLLNAMANEIQQIKKALYQQQNALQVSNLLAMANNSLLPEEFRQKCLAQACSLQQIDLKEVGLTNPNVQQLPADLIL